MCMCMYPHERSQLTCAGDNKAEGGAAGLPESLIVWEVVHGPLPDLEPCTACVRP